MSNMMLFGYEPERVALLYPSIRGAMQSLGLGDDAVITTVPSRVEYCDAAYTAAPYLRLCSTDLGEAARIKEAFAADEHLCRLDLEIVLIAEFIPGKRAALNHGVTREDVDPGGDGH